MSRTVSLVVHRARVPAGGELCETDLHVDGGHVVEHPVPGAEALDAGGGVVLPGLVDLQVNGGFGIDLASAPERVWELAALLPATGVTAFLPTLVSCAPATVDRALAASAAGPPPGWRGATPLGWHLEGPFLDPAHRGVHAEAMLRPPDLALARRWAATGQVRMVTLAPEQPGALDVVAALVEHGVVVAAGHSGATYEQGMGALDAGVRCATHLWNAMPPMAHREPGLSGAVLDDDRAVVCLIADGAHVHPAALRLARAVAGSGRLALVTDATAAAGLGAGRARLGDVDLVLGGDAPRDGDGRLAGSDLTMDEALRRYRRMTGAGWPELAEAAAGVPARLLGETARGHLGPGARADAVILDAGGEVCATLVGGEVHRPAGEGPGAGGEEGRSR